MDVLRLLREHLFTLQERFGVERIGVFGSFARGEHTDKSDVDVLVQFDPQHVPGLIRLARMERELATAFAGRKVDLRTAQDLSKYFRDEVVAQAEVQYAE